MEFRTLVILIVTSMTLGAVWGIKNELKNHRTAPCAVHGEAETQ